MIPFIDCDSTAAIVRAAGGDVEDGTEPVDNVVATDDIPAPADKMPLRPAPTFKGNNHTCRFKDRYALETALRAYVATNPNWLRVRFQRTGD